MEEKKRNSAKDFVVGIFLVALGVYIIVDSLSMRIYNTFIDAPGFFPLIIGVVITALGGILSIIGIRSGGIGELKEVLNGAYLKSFIKDDRTIRVLILLGMMAIYIYVLLGRIHFIAATSIYLAANFFYLRACKHWYSAIIIAVVASVAVYYAFRYGFSITLP
ncbi:MAG: tripartite tricarboxylate transporter TctB family protein [Clostridia bacterium]|nr:tripartite tricarboxylate transporter TctB family protein [Clostridia bacterium]